METSSMEKSKRLEDDMYLFIYFRDIYTPPLL